MRGNAKFVDLGYVRQLRGLSRPSSLATPAAPQKRGQPKRGAVHRAQILDPEQFAQFQDMVEVDSKTPERDLVGILLTFYCGLRAQEVAYLRWDQHILDARGGFRKAKFDDEIVHIIFISGDIGKRGMERVLPIPPVVVEALRALRKLRPTDVYVFHRLDCPPGYGPLTPNAVAQWFRRIYIKHGFDGCSSHSGRRSFITHGARRAQRNGCSLKDIQEMAGHASLATTQAYIEPSTQRAALVADLYSDDSLKQKPKRTYGMAR